MPRLNWSPQALLDVQRLYRFLAGKDVESAKRAARAIRQGVKILGQQPGMGRPIEDMEPEYREWLIDFGNSGYIALYRIDGDDATILAVRHQREVGYD